MRYAEHGLQSFCVRWFRLQYPRYAQLLIAVPNGARRSPQQARVLKEEGMLAGVADLLLLVPRHGYGCLCIEVKYGRNKQQENQIEWQRATEQAPNKYVVVRSVEQFMEAVNKYLN